MPRWRTLSRSGYKIDILLLLSWALEVWSKTSRKPKNAFTLIVIRPNDPLQAVPSKGQLWPSDFDDKDGDGGDVVMLMVEIIWKFGRTLRRDRRSDCCSTTSQTTSNIIIGDHKIIITRVTRNYHSHQDEYLITIARSLSSSSSSSSSTHY